MPNDMEFKTIHELLEAAMRLPPLKIAVVDATAKHVIEGAASAAIKGIRSPVSGQVDLLLVPDLVSCNIFVKNLEYLAEATLEVWCSGWLYHSHVAGRSSESPFGFRGYLPVCCSSDSRLALPRAQHDLPT